MISMQSKYSKQQNYCSVKILYKKNKNKTSNSMKILCFFENLFSYKNILQLLCINVGLIAVN